MDTDIAPINQDEIARKLKISKGTVSRALRNLPGINPQTRSLVMTTAAELGYRPQRTRTPERKSVDHRFVGVIQHAGVPQPEIASAAGSTDYVTGMADVANRLNVSLILLQVPPADADTLIENQIPALRDGLLSGIVLIHRWPAQVVKWLASRYVCVSLVHRAEGVSLDTVDMDHTGSMRDLVRHLHDLGHSSIGFFGHDPGVSWSNARFGGFVQALYAEGVGFDPSAVIAAPKDVLEGRSREIETQIDSVIERIKRGVRAWCASSDWIGYSLVSGLIARGIRVPEDVSITGFDYALIPEPGLPQLTTVRMNGAMMGAQALRQLLTRLETPSAPEQSISFQCAFVKGDTTARKL